MGNDTGGGAAQEDKGDEGGSAGATARTIAPAGSPKPSPVRGEEWTPSPASARPDDDGSSPAVGILLSSGRSVCRVESERLRFRHRTAGFQRIRHGAEHVGHRIVRIARAATAATTPATAATSTAAATTASTAAPAATTVDLQVQVFVTSVEQPCGRRGAGQVGIVDGLHLSFSFRVVVQSPPTQEKIDLWGVDFSGDSTRGSDFLRGPQARPAGPRPPSLSFGRPRW